MSESRRSQGMPLPPLGRMVVLLAAVSGCWLLYAEFRARVAPKIAESPTRRIIERAQLIESLAQSGRQALPKLVSMLSSPDAATRSSALDVLWRLGPDAGDALDAIRTRLADEKPQVRVDALMAFSKISQDTDDVIAVAVQSLEDDNERVRLSAASILQAFGQDAGPQVLEYARATLPRDGRLVMRLLRRDLPGVEEAWRRLVNHPDAIARREAIQQFLGLHVATPDEVRAWLHDGDPKVVELAVRAIGGNDGEAAADFLPELLSLLEHADGELLSCAIRAVSGLKTAASSAIPLLMDRVEGLDDNSRVTAAEALLDMGADPQVVVRIVLPLLEKRPREHFYNCESAGVLLVRTSPEEARRLVAQLVGEIEADGTLKSGPIFWTLRGLAPQAQAAVPVLSRLVSHSDSYVRQLAVEMLGRIGGDAAPAVPILIQSLERKGADSSEYEAVVRALGQIGPAARPAVTALLRTINDAGHPLDKHGRPINTYPLRAAALDALTRVGDASAEVVAAVRRQLADDSDVREAAVLSLVALAAESAETLQAIIPLLKADEQSVRIHAALAIGFLSGDRREAIAGLTALLLDDDPHIATAAALALREIGPAANSAVTALREIAGDPRNSILNGYRASPFAVFGLPSASRGEDLHRISVAAAAQLALAAIEPQGNDASDDSTTPESKTDK